MPQAPPSRTVWWSFTHIQRYLQYGLLQEMGLIHFDDWASDFGETITAIEAFLGRHRLSGQDPVCQVFQSAGADGRFQTGGRHPATESTLHLPVPKANFHTEVIKPSELQQEMVKGLAERAEKIRDGGVDPHVDNMLRITNDGRKLALDMRLINPLAADDRNGKGGCLRPERLQNLEQTKEQLFDPSSVFCDLSTPTKKTALSNVYDESEKKLMEQGIPGG